MTNNEPDYKEDLYFENSKIQPIGIDDTKIQANLTEQCKKGELAKVKQQLAIAVEQLKDTYVICFRNKDTFLHTPEHNIIGGIERDCAIALQQIKELESDE